MSQRRVLCERAAERASKLAGITIPWDLIQQLVEWFLENCFASGPLRARFVDAARHPTGFQERALHWQAIAVGRAHWSGRDLRAAAYAMTSAMLEVGEAASEAELAAAAE